MKLLRYGSVGRECPSILDPCGKVRDLSGVVDEIDGETVSPDGLARLHALDLESLPLANDVEPLGSCAGRPGKSICIGLHYADHAAETGAAVPKEPVVFLKATMILVNP